jgi:hypothetical protein
VLIEFITTAKTTTSATALLLHDNKVAREVSLQRPLHHYRHLDFSSWPSCAQVCTVAITSAFKHECTMLVSILLIHQINSNTIDVNFMAGMRRSVYSTTSALASKHACTTDDAVAVASILVSAQCELTLVHAISVFQRGHCPH